MNYHNFKKRVMLPHRFRRLHRFFRLKGFLKTVGRKTVTNNEKGVTEMAVTPWLLW
jgi:hypothetical protein